MAANTAAIHVPFPRFFLLNFRPNVSNFDHIEQDRSGFDFPVMLDMTPSAFEGRSCC
jgi:hypothetical protein